MIVHQDKWNVKLRISSIRWKRGQGGMENFIQCEGLVFMVTGILKTRFHIILQYNLLSYFLVVVVDKPVEVNIS